MPSWLCKTLLLAVVITAASGVVGCGGSHPAHETACQVLTPALTIAVVDQQAQDTAGHETWITGGTRPALVQLAAASRGRAPVLRKAAQAMLLNTPTYAPHWLQDYNYLRSVLVQQAHRCHIALASGMKTSNPWRRPRPEPGPIAGRPAKIPKPGHASPPKAAASAAPQGSPAPTPGSSGPAKPDESCSQLDATAVYYTPTEHRRDMLTCQVHTTASGTRRIWMITGH